MHQAGTKRPGTMAAVLGLETAAVEPPAGGVGQRRGGGARQPQRSGADRDLGDPEAVARAAKAAKRAAPNG